MGWTLVVRVVDARERDAAADDLVAGFGAGFLVVERAAPDELFERVVVLVFRAEEEVPRDAMGVTLTHAAPADLSPTPSLHPKCRWAWGEPGRAHGRGMRRATVPAALLILSLTACQSDDGGVDPLDVPRGDSGS